MQVHQLFFVHMIDSTYTVRLDNSTKHVHGSIPRNNQNIPP